MSTYNNIKALAFDHYGTLFDKHAVAKIMEEQYPRQGEALAKLWFSTLKQYCFLSGMMERYVTWDELTKRALTYAGKSLSLEVPPELHEKLIQADLVLPPFPEVPAALKRLAEKFTLVVLTMASAWMVEASQKNAGVEQYFKEIISAEPYKVYKPGRHAYDLAVQRLELPKEQIGFVSGNSFDVMGGKHYGFPTFWINRTGEPLDELGPQPDLVVPDLAGLADKLCG
ncbi:MAG: haloacid dehalogenase type II [Acidiferrobacterales bacterium]